jgi:hypothetical protein
MAVRPFLESGGSVDDDDYPDEVLTPRSIAASSFDYKAFGHSSSQPSTPRGGVLSHPLHTEVQLLDMAPSNAKDTSSRHGPSRRQAPTGVARSGSFADQTRPSSSHRHLLSIDSPPMDLVSPRGPPPSRGPPGAARDVSPANHASPGRTRPKSTRVKKRVGELPRGAVAPSPLHMQPLGVMKLPPLETAVSKTGSTRDLVCVGKD